MTRQELRLRQEIEAGPSTGGHGQHCELNHWVGATGFTRHIDEFKPNTQFNTDIIVSILTVDRFIQGMMQ